MAEPSLSALASSGAEHGSPSDGMECLATMDDITLEDGNYCEYLTMPSNTWHPSAYCGEVVQRLILTQFGEYVKGVRQSDCEADLKRRLAAGPPVWLADKHALPLPDGDTHIERVWMSSDRKEYTAKLAGCVEGDEREKLWEELRNFAPGFKPGDKIVDPDAPEGDGEEEGAKK